jgi:hypothetical protein
LCYCDAARETEFCTAGRKEASKYEIKRKRIGKLKKTGK